MEHLSILGNNQPNIIIGGGLATLVLLGIYIKLLDIYQWKLTRKGGAYFLVWEQLFAFCLFNGWRKKKTGKDVSRAKRRRYKYKEMESGAHSKSNIIIPSNSFCFNFSKNKYW